MIAGTMVLYFPAINAENKQNCKYCNLAWILKTQLYTNTRTHHMHWHYRALLSHISQTIHWSCWLTTFMFLSTIRKYIYIQTHWYTVKKGFLVWNQSLAYRISNNLLYKVKNGYIISSYRTIQTEKVAIGAITNFHNIVMRLNENLS